LKGINVGIITSNSNDKSEQILIQKGENETPFVKLIPSKKDELRGFRRMNTSDAKISNIYKDRYFE
jgi:hypothetical protein